MTVLKRIKTNLVKPLLREIRLVTNQAEIYSAKQNKGILTLLYKAAVGKKPFEVGVHFRPSDLVVLLQKNKSLSAVITLAGEQRRVVSSNPKNWATPIIESVRQMIGPKPLRESRFLGQKTKGFPNRLLVEFPGLPGDAIVLEVMESPSQATYHLLNQTPDLEEIRKKGFDVWRGQTGSQIAEFWFGSQKIPYRDNGQKIRDTLSQPGSGSLYWKWHSSPFEQQAPQNVAMALNCPVQVIGNQSGPIKSVLASQCLLLAECHPDPWDRIYAELATVSEIVESTPIQSGLFDFLRGKGDIKRLEKSIDRMLEILKGLASGQTEIRKLVTQNKALNQAIRRKGQQKPVH